MKSKPISASVRSPCAANHLNWSIRNSMGCFWLTMPCGLGCISRLCKPSLILIASVSPMPSTSWILLSMSLPSWPPTTCLASSNACSLICASPRPCCPRVACVSALAWSNAPFPLSIASNAGISLSASQTPPSATFFLFEWHCPHGSRIASGGDGKAVHIWNANTGRTILKYTGHSGLLPDVFALAWSPDGSHIASACSSIGMDQTIHIWNTRTGESVLSYPTRCGWLPSFSVLALTWSPDGTRIASTCGDKNVRIWDARNGENLAIYTTPADWVRDLAWSPDSRFLAVANGTKADNSIQIWDTATGGVILTYSGHTDSIRNIAWSPNGVYLASASNDNTVRVWNVTTGDTLTTYRGHRHWATAVAWSPDGMRIASASNDKTVRIWRPFVMSFV